VYSKAQLMAAEPAAMMEKAEMRKMATEV